MSLSDRLRRLGVPQLEVLEDIRACGEGNLQVERTMIVSLHLHPPSDTRTLTGTFTAARPRVRQFPSAFDTVIGSSFTVQICAGSSEQSSMNSVCDAVPGTTPRADTHQSPHAIWPGTPVPKTGKRAVMSLKVPSPGRDAASPAPLKPPSGANTREMSMVSPLSGRRS